MRKTITYQDFPVTKETENLKIWKGLDINQKGRINIGKNEQIHESRLYPFKEGKQKIKVLSKINKDTNKITFIITSGNLISEHQTTTVNEYMNLIRSLENDMERHITINQNNFLTGKQIQHQINQINTENRNKQNKENTENRNKQNKNQFNKKKTNKTKLKTKLRKRPN